MRDYRKLEAYRRAHELVLAVYRVTKAFPSEERFGLTNQIRRASVSITSNIVEGSARNSEAEYRRFLEIAHSSSWEVEYQLQLSMDLEFCPESRPAVEETLKLCRQVCRQLHRLTQAFDAKEGE